MNFMAIYAFSLAITLAIGVAGYSTVFPAMVASNPPISEMYNQTIANMQIFLKGDISGFADGFFATAYIMWSSIQLAVFLLISAPVLVEQTLNYFGLPSALALPILTFNMIAFVGTVYNILRGLKALVW